MDTQDILRCIFSSMVNQSLINRENQWVKLPDRQEQALNSILNDIHDIFENRKKIDDKYQQQALDAFVLKMASEMGIDMMIGG